MKRHSVYRDLIIFSVYLAIAAITTLPLAAHMRTHLPDGTDTLLHYWNGWAIEQALREGRGVYHTSYLFYPTGVSLVYSNLGWLHILPWLALEPIAGGIAAYNLIFLLHLALCGFAAFFLVIDLTGDWRVAFLSGLIYQCWPYRMTQPSHPNLMSMAFVPIMMLFLQRAIRKARWQDGFWLGIAMALVGYTRWQLLIPTTIVGGVYWLLTLPQSAKRKQMLVLMLGGTVTILVLLPPMLLLAREWRTNPAELVVAGEELTMLTDALAYLVPPSSHPVLGIWTEPIYKRLYAERGSRSAFSPYVGVVALALTLLGIFGGHRQETDWKKTFLQEKLPWIGIAVVLVLLALGPVLTINGKSYPNIPMLYNLAARLFIVRLLRVPDRFNMTLALPIAVLSAGGIRYTLAWLATKSGGASPAHKGLSASASGKRFPLRLCATVLPGLLGVVILFEYLIVPLPLQSARVSTFYKQLASEPDNFAVLNLPLDPYRSKPAMFAQTIHMHPIVQGHVSRYPKGTFDYLRNQPWLREMRAYSLVPPKQTDISRQLGLLADDDIRYVIVHKEWIGAEHWPSWERYLAIPPHFEDDEIAAYKTTPIAGQDFALSPEWLPGIGIIRSSLSNQCINPGQVLELDVAWGTNTPIDTDFDVKLELLRGITTISAGFPLSGGWPSSKWPENAVVWGYYAVDIPAETVPGEYDLALSLVNAATGTVQQAPIVIERIDVSTNCPFAAPADAVGVNALFDGEMRLLGYQLSQGPDQLQLRLYWRPEHRMNTDFKIFVHVFDPVTGIPVAQSDTMPLNWTYPTTYWGLEQTVTDLITIPLADAPPGEYGLAVGIYDPTNGERLTVLDRNGQEQADNRLVLAGETIKIE
ncbi:MAG: hypothetical protein JXA89_05185 [Anaerolineae bacterium]|nr:hypothetical protein [Anaerolineae bacterium]